jgi:hypothetical protein
MIRPKEELELAEHIYMQLHKLGLESLNNLKYYVLVEIEIKTEIEQRKIKESA